MLPLKLRLKILNKLAQAVPGSPPSPASPASPASPSTTTSPTSTVAGPSKSPSAPASAMMNLGVGWPNFIPQIDKLVAKVDKVLIAGTKNKFNFNDLFQNKFPSGVETEFAPPDPTGDVIRFAKQIFQYIMNSGVPFQGALQHGDMRNRVGALVQSPYLQKFQQVNMQGPLAGVGADLSTLRSDLQNLYQSIPAQ
jgi:hypothetical protein